METAPIAHATTHNNLGTVYLQLAERQQGTKRHGETLKQAIWSYEAALGVVESFAKDSSPSSPPSALPDTRDSVPVLSKPLVNVGFDRWVTHFNLGQAYRNLAMDRMVSFQRPQRRLAYWQKALEHYHHSLISSQSPSQGARAHQVEMLLQQMLPTLQQEMKLPKDHPIFTQVQELERIISTGITF